mmetsp:Transcript_17529/g.36279  ORF Transcript_17529/g.36279 Transcript_17529/m.36279 type:complete len:222 (+) Transcript_17529:2660-3325(+)
MSSGWRVPGPTPRMITLTCLRYLHIAGAFKWRSAKSCGRERTTEGLSRKRSLTRRSCGAAAIRMRTIMTKRRTKIWMTWKLREKRRRKKAKAFSSSLEGARMRMSRGRAHLRTPRPLSTPPLRPPLSRRPPPTLRKTTSLFSYSFVRRQTMATSLRPFRERGTICIFTCTLPKVEAATVLLRRDRTLTIPSTTTSSPRSLPCVPLMMLLQLHPSMPHLFST